MVPFMLGTPKKAQRFFPFGFPLRASKEELPAKKDNGLFFSASH